MTTKKQEADPSASDTDANTMTATAELDQFLQSPQTSVGKPRSINLGGLWLNTSRHGAVYLSGSLGACRIMVFKNPNKLTDDHPDYNIVLGERPPKAKAPADALHEGDGMGVPD